MKTTTVPILIGMLTAVAGAGMAVAWGHSSLGTVQGTAVGVAIAAVIGAIGATFATKSIERRVVASLFALDSTGKNRTQSLPPPTGLETVDAVIAGLVQSLENLVQSRSEFEEFERLARSLSAYAGDGRTGGGRDARSNLRIVLEEFGQAASMILEAAEGLGAATERIASGASQQAAAIGRTTTTVEALSDQIDRISENAEAGAEESEHTRMEASRGLEQVKSAIEGMERLRSHVDANGRKVRRLGDRSMEIGTIVELITGISQRTDMLALNATIESVRAGEHGRGFAVVAEEIRKLAERAAGATREIGALVETIQEDTQECIKALVEEQAEVEQEAERVRAAGAALERISQFAERSARLVESISQSTQGQVRATHDLVRNAQQISEVAQQSLDGAAKAKEQLRDLSQRCGRLLRLAAPESKPPSRPPGSDGSESHTTNGSHPHSAGHRRNT